MKTLPMLRTAILALTTLLGSGCAAWHAENPPGFALAREGGGDSHWKAGDDVGLSVRRFANVEGGTLAFWSDDLVRKLERRGYQLERRTTVRSANRIPGTRFDFTYTSHPGSTRPDAAPKFYTATLFATNRHRVVVQMAGDAAAQASHEHALTEFLAQLTVRGCAGRGDVC